MSRIFLNDEQLHIVAPVLEELELKFFLSPQKYLFNTDVGKGGFSNSAATLLPHNAPCGSFMVHLGRDIGAVFVAREADLSGDDVELGKALGVPDCCIGAFVRNAEEAADAQNDFTLFACVSTCGEPDPWVINCAQYFGYGLVSHFPCSMNCEKTAAIAKAAARLLHDRASEIAAQFLRYQAASYLYTEYDGVYAFLERPKKSHQDEWIYDGRQIEMSSRGLLSEALRKGNRLTVRAPSDFTIMSRTSEVMTVRSEAVFLLLHDCVLSAIE